jgi:nicotinamidase-related amidase
MLILSKKITFVNSLNKQLTKYYYCVIIKIVISKGGWYMKNLLVIIDMVNGFINFGNLADKNINKITNNIVLLIKDSLKNKDDIIAFKDTHSNNDKEFKIYPIHCVKGSEECELIKELKIFENRMKIIEKDTTNGFNTKEFSDFIKEHIYDNIIVCGCCTDICIKNFCESMVNYLKINNLKTKVIVYEKSVSTFDSESHNSIKMQNDAINDMKQNNIIIK